MNTSKVNSCMICKRVFLFDESFKKQYPAATASFCGRASCRRKVGEKRPVRNYEDFFFGNKTSFSFYSLPIVDRRLFSFTKDPDIRKLKITCFKAFDSRRRIAVQRILDRKYEEVERLFVELLRDMLPTGISSICREEFLRRKRILGYWLHEARLDALHEKTNDKTSTIESLFERINTVLYAAIPPPSDYRTRTVFRKATSQETPERLE